MEGLVDATRAPGDVADPQECRAFVAPRGRMLRPHPKDLVVAGDRSPVVPEFVKGRPLVDPRLDGPRVDLEQAVVRLSLLLESADLVEGRGEAKPSLLRFPVDLQGLRERLDRARDVPVLPENVAPQEPRRVVFRLQLDRGVVLAQRALEVSAVERPACRPPRVLQPIDAP